MKTIIFFCKLILLLSLSTFAQNAKIISKNNKSQVFDIDTITNIKNKEIKFTEIDTLYTINAFGLKEIQRLNKLLTLFKANTPLQLKELQSNITTLENDIKKLQNNNDSLLTYIKNFNVENTIKIGEIKSENNELIIKIKSLENKILEAIENTQKLEKQNKKDKIRWGASGLITGLIIGLLLSI